MPFAPFGWPAMPTQAVSSPFPSSVYGPFAAWLNMFPMTAPSAAWPMAFMMMASGVPRSVAWPTAEANAAVMDAAGAAAASVRKVYSSYHTEGGHSAGGRNTWPSAPLFALALPAAHHGRHDVGDARRLSRGSDQSRSDGATASGGRDLLGHALGLLAAMRLARSCPTLALSPCANSISRYRRTRSRTDPTHTDGAAFAAFFLGPLAASP